MVAACDRINDCSGEITTVGPHTAPASASKRKQSDLPEPVGARWTVSRPSSCAAMQVQACRNGRRGGDHPCAACTASRRASMASRRDPTRS